MLRTYNIHTKPCDVILLSLPCRESCELSKDNGAPRTLSAHDWPLEDVLLERDELEAVRELFPKPLWKLSQVTLNHTAVKYPHLIFFNCVFSGIYM